MKKEREMQFLGFYEVEFPDGHTEELEKYADYSTAEIVFKRGDEEVFRREMRRSDCWM